MYQIRIIGLNESRVPWKKVFHCIKGTARRRGRDARATVEACEETIHLIAMLLQERIQRETGSQPTVVFA